MRRFLLVVGGLFAAVVAGCGGGSATSPVATSEGTRAGAPALTPGADGRVKVFIGFKQTPGAKEQALVRQAGGTVKYSYTIVPAIAASLPAAAVDGLAHNPSVSVIEPDVEVQASTAEYTAATGAWGVGRIGAEAVYDAGNTGAGIKVAVIDTGIDKTHTELAAHYAGGWDFVNNDADPVDDNGHGTHVAGTIGAAHDGAGVVGVAPGVTLYSLKVLDSLGSGYFSDVVAALQWCMANGIQVTNNSYGSSRDPGSTVETAFNAAYGAEIVNVAAAGNSGNAGGKGNNVGYPARYASVIAVTATDQSDTRAYFSSTGPDAELAAPGVSIRSCHNGGGYVIYSGTSMASPHVAGVAALVWAAGATSAAEVRQRMDDSAEDLGAAGRDSWYGFGLVSAPGAVNASPPPPPPPPPPPSGALTATISDLGGPYGNRDTVPITVTVTDGTNAVSGAAVHVVVTALQSGRQSVADTTTNGSGIATVNFKVNTKRDGTGTYTVDATASAAGYTNGTAVQKSFTVQ